MTLTLRFELLGAFRLLRNGEQITSLMKPRQQALLAYLLLHRHAPQSRQQIAFTFWPDSTEEQAYSNLRKLFFQLRQSLPNTDDFLIATAQTLGWRPDAPFTLDVAEVEQSLDLLEEAASPSMATELADAPFAATVERVVKVYRGELLPSCYDDWLFPLRRELHQRTVNLLTHSLLRLDVQHQFTVGLLVAEHLMRLDPLNEAAYRHLMQMRALTGDRAGALRLYHECVTLLQQELGVSPVLETQALYLRLLNSEQAQSATPLDSKLPSPILSPILSPISAPFPRHEYVPLVGRQREWKILQQAWHEMSVRGAHFITVWGEAGVGKSRLLEELLRWARLRPGTVVYARAYAAEGALSYAPLTEWLRSEALRPVLERCEPHRLSELARLLPELLTAQPTLSPPAPMIEGWQRLRFHQELAQTMLAAPASRLLLLDDLQWCDAETLAWLRFLMRIDPPTPLLVVATVRSEAVVEEHPLHDLVQQLQRASQYTALELAPLTVEETALLAGHQSEEGFVEGLPGEEEIAHWTAQLYRETEGNPLFIVEMARAGTIGRGGDSQEASAMQRAGSRALPATVQAVIAQRLNQLSPPACQLVQLAATVGRAFTFEVLATASEVSDGELVQALDELWQRRIVRERGQGYDFSHDKIREVAYNSMSPMRRRLLHRQVAGALEALHSQGVSEVAGLLAAHYTQAGERAKALTYLMKAGHQANRLSANQEALHYYQQALTMAQNEDEKEPIREQRAAIYLELYQGKEVVEEFQQLLRHSDAKGNRQQQLEYLLGLMNGYYVVALDDQASGAALKVRDLYCQTQRLARELGDKRNLVHSLLLPVWHLWPELIEESIANAKEAFALSVELGDEDLTLKSKMALIQSAVEQEQAEIGAALVAELEARHDLNRLNLAYNYLMWIHYHLGNFRHMVTLCEAGIEVAAKLGLPPVVYPTLKAFALLALGEYGAAWESLQMEVADDAHVFGRAFKATGTGMFLVEVGAHAEAALLLEGLITQAKQLQRTWLAEWARVRFVRALLPAGPQNVSEWARVSQSMAAADANVLQGLKPWRAQMLTLQAEIALAEKQFEKTQQLLQEVVALTKANGYRAYLLAAWEVETRLLVQVQRPAAALDRLEQALQLAGALEALPLAWRLQATKAAALMALGQEYGAAQARQRAVAIMQKLAATLHDAALRQGFLAQLH